MSTFPAPVRLTWTPELLSIEWADGVVTDFAAIWLRDNLPTDRNPHNGQRLVDIADLPACPLIRVATADHDSIHVEWEGESLTASFSLAWLVKCTVHEAEKCPERCTRPWLNGATLDAGRDFAWTSHATFSVDPRVKLQWLTKLLQTGLAFLSAVPATDRALGESVAGIGRICETNYGLVFDVRSVPNPENMAYSDVGLGLHTDNPYRDPVPGFQALHVLLASPDGGDSLFADGFAMSNHLRCIDPAAFDLLTTTPVPFHFRGPGADLHAERPLIQLSAAGVVTAVHYNSRSIAPLAERGKEATHFYSAYRKFAQLLRHPSHQLRTRLRAGDLAVFDNQRILHGRTAFSSNDHARHLRGCYLSRDSVYSETAQLRLKIASQVFM